MANRQLGVWAALDGDYKQALTLQQELTMRALECSSNAFPLNRTCYFSRCAANVNSSNILRGLCG